MANPIVTITMENGAVMKAELYPDIAPNTVNNFISLVKKGYYDGLIFHRVINGFMMKNWEPPELGCMALAMESTPSVCTRSFLTPFCANSPLME